MEERKSQLTSKITQIQESIHHRVNIKEKIELIQYKTEKEISKMFDVGSENIKKDLEDKKLKYESVGGRFFRLINEETSRREKEELDRLRDMAKSDGNKLIFSDENELNNFQRTSSLFVNNFANEYIAKAFESILSDSLSEVKNVTNEINLEGEKLVSLLKDKFNKDGFDLRIEFDATANLDKNTSRITNIKLNANKKEYSETRKESGVMGGAKRLFGGLFGKSWGTYTVNYTTYTIQKDEIVEQFMNVVDDYVITPLQNQVDEKVKELLNQSMDYIDDFGKKVDEITYEIQQSLEYQQTTVNQSKSEKEDEKQFISSLRQSHDDLDEDWQKLKEVFKVEDIKS